MKKILLFLLMLAMLPAAVHAETTLYIDGGSADRVHLRSAPSREADSLGLYYSGTPVTLLGMDVGWKQVRIGEETGWVMAAYLADDPKPMTGPIATVVNPNDTWVNLRAAASTKCRAVAQVPTYDKVYILGEMANGWYYISWRSQEGFMMSRFLEIQEEQPVTVPTAVGKTPDGQYIQRMIADNGQWLYFTAVEERPPVKYEDVNFDGIPDIVVTTSIGASNFYTAFFVWDGSGYVYAENNGTDYGLVNYSLFPEYGIVMSQGSNGWAGALTETCLFRWEGTNLKILRRLVSEELTETAFNQDTIVTTLWTEKLQVRIWDYQGNDSGTLLMDRVFSQTETDADWHRQINDALWKGIRDE